MTTPEFVIKIVLSPAVTFQVEGSKIKGYTKLNVVSKMNLMNITPGIYVIIVIICYLI